MMPKIRKPLLSFSSPKERRGQAIYN